MGKENAVIWTPKRADLEGNRYIGRRKGRVRGRASLRSWATWGKKRGSVGKGLATQCREWKRLPPIQRGPYDWSKREKTGKVVKKNKQSSSLKGIEEAKQRQNLRGGVKRGLSKG